MDAEGYEDNSGYDSDLIDEETQSKLYSAVFYDHDQSSKLPDVTNVYDSELSRSPALSILTSTRGTLHECPYAFDAHLTARATDLACKENFQLNGIKERNEFSANISSFKDDVSSSDSEGFTINCAPITNVSSSDNESVITIQSTHSDMSVHISKHLNDSDWSADNVVLGISNETGSHVCNSDDSVAIARRLSSCSSDPNMWRIAQIDRTPISRKTKSRYFEDSHNTVCLKCKRSGHLSLQCKNAGPVCIFCGKDDHDKQYCKNVYCYACLAPGHLKMSCPLLHHMTQSVCGRCGLNGHDAETRQGKPVRTPRQMEVDPRGCCNCGKRGHSANECKRKPFRSGLIGPLPRRHVLVYDTKDIYGKKKLKIGNKKKNGGKVLKKKKSSKKGEGFPNSVSKSTPLHEDTQSKRFRCPQMYSPVEKYEREVNERLFEAILERNNRSPLMPCEKNEQTGVDSCRNERTSIDSCLTTKQIPRRSSMDGAAFLPLDGTTKKRSPSFATNHRNRKSGSLHRVRSAPSFSPFVWVNNKTATEQLNDQISLGNLDASHHDGTEGNETSTCHSVRKKRPLPDYEKRRTDVPFYRKECKKKRGSKNRSHSVETYHFSEKQLNVQSNMKETQFHSARNPSSTHHNEAPPVKRRKKKRKQPPTSSSSKQLHPSFSPQNVYEAKLDCFNVLSGSPHIEIWD